MAGPRRRQIEIVQIVHSAEPTLRDLNQWQFFLVFAAATGAFFFAVLSFHNKERHWPWAAVAALLSPSLLPANVIY